MMFIDGRRGVTPDGAPFILVEVSRHGDSLVITNTDTKPELKEYRTDELIFAKEATDD
jgi:hypothetical protein